MESATRNPVTIRAKVISQLADMDLQGFDGLAEGIGELFLQMWHNYGDVFGNSYMERGYSISDENNQWQWVLYTPDTSNNQQLCFAGYNTSINNSNTECLFDNGSVQD